MTTEAGSARALAPETTHFWLRSPSAWLAYLAAWACFAAGFATLFVFSEQPSLGRALAASAAVVIPAAVLGVGVVGLCRVLPYPPRRPLVFALSHAFLAAMYPIVWIALVAGPRMLGASLEAGRVVLTLPPEHVAHWHLATGVLLYVTIAGITYAIDRARRAELLLREAELAALRSQLHPHFLFNTLHSLLSLARSDGAAAARALEQLAQILRYTLGTHRGSGEVRLEEEWSFTRDYLDLERLRLGDRLQVETEVDEEALDCLVPAFVLQPLVENAVRCAVAPRAAGGTIRIRACRVDGVLQLEVGDDGPGAAESEPSGAFGLGLRAARERIAARYGKLARFEATSSASGFLVSIRLPLSGMART